MATAIGPAVMSPITQLTPTDLSAVQGGLGGWGKALYAASVALTMQGPMLQFPERATVAPAYSTIQR